LLSFPFFLSFIIWLTTRLRSSSLALKRNIKPVAPRSTVGPFWAYYTTAPYVGSASPIAPARTLIKAVNSLQCSVQGCPPTAQRFFRIFDTQTLILFVVHFLCTNAKKYPMTTEKCTIWDYSYTLSAQSSMDFGGPATNALGLWMLTKGWTADFTRFCLCMCCTSSSCSSDILVLKIFEKSSSSSLVRLISFSSSSVLVLKKCFQFVDY